MVAPTIASLLDEYLLVERPFAKRANGAADALYELRESYRDDLSALVEIAASHASLKQKNKVMVNFLQAILRPDIAMVLGEENSQTSVFKTKLHQLSQLFAPAYADIALKARLMLADFRRPRFHQRKGGIGQLLESICSAPPERRSFAMRNIVGISESMFDVLVTFVLPSEPCSVPAGIRQAAAEALILRSYRAYNVQNLKVDVDDDSSAPLLATWNFKFCKQEGDSPSTTPVTSPVPAFVAKQLSRGIASFDSADNLSRGHSSLEIFEMSHFAKGLMVAFGNWDEMEDRFDSVLEGYASCTNIPPGEDINVMTVLLRWDADLSAKGALSTNPTSNAVGDCGLSEAVSMRHFLRDPLSSEDLVSDALSNFCRAEPGRINMARRGGVRSITFIVVPPAGESTTYPGFFTFKTRDECKEDPIFRHIDPPMAFQLELARLSNYKITRFGYPARTVHVFFAQDKAVRKRRQGTPPTPKKRRNL